MAANLFLLTCDVADVQNKYKKPLIILVMKYTHTGVHSFAFERNEQEQTEDIESV